MGLLVLFFLSLAGVIYMLLTFPPNISFSILIFLALLFLCIYSLVGFFMKSALQGIIVASLLISFLLFHLFGLTNPLFLILLIILFVCLEGVLWKKR